MCDLGINQISTVLSVDVNKNIYFIHLYISRVTPLACLAFRAVAAYLKVVRRRKRSSAEGTRGGEHERGVIPLSLGVFWGLPPRKVLNFERFYVRL